MEEVSETNKSSEPKENDYETLQSKAFPFESQSKQVAHSKTYNRLDIWDMLKRWRNYDRRTWLWHEKLKRQKLQTYKKEQKKQSKQEIQKNNIDELASMIESINQIMPDLEKWSSIQPIFYYENKQNIQYNIQSNKDINDHQKIELVKQKIDTAVQTNGIQINKWKFQINNGIQDELWNGITERLLCRLYKKNPNLTNMVQKLRLMYPQCFGCLNEQNLKYKLNLILMKFVHQIRIQCLEHHGIDPLPQSINLDLFHQSQTGILCRKLLANYVLKKNKTANAGLCIMRKLRSLKRKQGYVFKKVNYNFKKKIIKKKKKKEPTDQSQTQNIPQKIAKIIPQNTLQNQNQQIKEIELRQQNQYEEKTQQQQDKKQQDHLIKQQIRLYYDVDLNRYLKVHEQMTSQKQTNQVLLIQKEIKSIILSNFNQS